MKIGVFGGTFNPVHQGHIRLAKAFSTEIRLDRLLIIPANAPPHKDAPHLVAGRHRLEMCRMAFADVSKVQVSDLEIRRGGRSVTADTLEALKTMYPMDELYLLMGADMLLTFTQWKRWQDILRLSVLCAAVRAPYDNEDLVRQQQFIIASGGRCVLLHLPPVDISSTALRETLFFGGYPGGQALPEDVFQYIKNHGLYTGKV